MKGIYIFSVFLVVSLFFSCNKEYVIADNLEAVSVQAVLNKPATKGIISGTSVPVSRDIKLSADLNTSTGAGSVTNYFSGVQFTYSAGVSGWVPLSGSYYWPLTGTLDMLAVSPGSVTLSSGPTFTNATQVTMSSADWRADDVLMGGLAGANSSSNQLAFRHCLAKINLQAKASVASVVKIKSVTINAKTGATLTVNKSNGSGSTSVSTSLTGSATDCSLFSGNQTLSTSYASLGSAVLLPAQTPASMTITYSIRQGGSGGTDSSDGTVTVALSQALSAGNSYTYRIDATLNEFSVYTALTAWNSGSDVDLQIPDPIAFAGLQIAPGPLYYNGTSYEIKDNWNYSSFNSKYGKTSGSTYFNFIEMGQLFEKADFSKSDGNVENLLNPLDGWRLPTKAEWQAIVGTTRAGSTVNGSAGKHYARIQLTGVTPYIIGTSTPKGLLLFPDGATITGKALSGMDNWTWTTGVTTAELNAYMEQDCAFLPITSQYIGYWESDRDNCYYWSSTEYDEDYAYNLSCQYLELNINNKSSRYIPVRLVK